MSHYVVWSVWWWVVGHHGIQIAIAVIDVSVMRQVDDGLLWHVTVAVAHIGGLEYVCSCSCKGSLRLWLAPLLVAVGVLIFVSADALAESVRTTRQKPPSRHAQHLACDDCASKPSHMPPSRHACLQAVTHASEPSCMLVPQVVFHYASSVSIFMVFSVLVLLWIIGIRTVKRGLTMTGIFASMGGLGSMLARWFGEQIKSTLISLSGTYWPYALAATSAHALVT